MKKFVDYLEAAQKGKSKPVKQQEKTGLEEKRKEAKLEELRKDAKSELHQSSRIDLATLKSFPEVTELLKLVKDEKNIKFIPKLEAAINKCNDGETLQGFINSLKEYED